MTTEPESVVARTPDRELAIFPLEIDQRHHARHDLNRRRGGRGRRSIRPGYRLHLAHGETSLWRRFDDEPQIELPRAEPNRCRRPADHLRCFGERFLLSHAPAKRADLTFRPCRRLRCLGTASAALFRSLELDLLAPCLEPMDAANDAAPRPVEVLAGLLRRCTAVDDADELGVLFGRPERAGGQQAALAAGRPSPPVT